MNEQKVKDLFPVDLIKDRIKKKKTLRISKELKIKAIGLGLFTILYFIIFYITN